MLGLQRPWYQPKGRVPVARACCRSKAILQETFLCIG